MRTPILLRKISQLISHDLFAFSYDITWGTDYPYSGVFWNYIYNTNWQYININLGGTVRMADIEIKVGNKTVVN